jgi:hypothetical protein
MIDWVESLPTGKGFDPCGLEPNPRHAWMMRPVT